MAVSKSKKQGILDALKGQMKDAKAVVFADYQGLSVKDLKALRRLLTDKGVEIKVAKKTLIKLAAKDAGYLDIPDNVMEGPVAVAFSMESEVAAAKCLNEFAKKNQNLKLRGALFGGKILSIAETKVLATIPSKEELISKFIYLIKYPVSGFHGALHGVLSGFVRALNAVREKKEQTA
ncbi:50S ribosomal protein L10 [Candidatus Peregrinibacteria bacterium]|nr:50S ribosomal protein L10 [Candidatus Peregrinibacteria bacterium]